MISLTEHSFTISITNVDGICDLPEIELMTGIITLTGRNNVGKSRIMRKISEFQEILLGVDHMVYANQLESSLKSKIVDREKEFEITMDRSKRSVDVIYREGKNLKANVNVVNSELKHWGAQGTLTTSSGRIAISDATHSLGDSSVLTQNLKRIVYIPPYRTIMDRASTKLETTVGPSGNNLGQILYFHKNKETSQFHEIERVMHEIFPEIENILTVPSQDNYVTITIKDGYSGVEVSISDAGTGVAQTLFLVTMILCSEKGKIFLIDEPHVYLHPNSEKALAKFLKEHKEHYYLIATHSPLLISKLNPDTSYLVTRDKSGTKMTALFRTTEDREEVFHELGIEPSDVVLFESLIFVEGDSDKLIYKILLDKLELSGLSKIAEIVDISGAGTSEPIERVLDRLDSILNIPHVVILDGDQNGKKKGTHIQFLPYRDIEHVLLLDYEAVYKSISEILQEDDKKQKLTSELHITLEETEKLIDDSINKDIKGDAILEKLFQMAKSNLHYNKRKYGPKIAENMNSKYLGSLKKFFESLFP